MLKERTTCMAKDCKARAVYFIYEIQPDGSKRPGYVCRLHEGLIGDNNMIQQGYDPRTGKEV